MSTRTKTTVANLALREIGTYRIEDFDEDSADAEVIRDLWDETLLFCIASHEWRFAMKHGRLQQTDFVQQDAFSQTFSGDFLGALKYDYAYVLPGDYVRLSSLSEYDDMKIPCTDFSLYSSDDGSQKIIAANSDTLYIDYISNMENPISWPPYFTDYFVAMLASKIASPLKSTIERQRLLDYAIKVALPMARGIDSTQQPPRMPPTGTWIRAMRGGVG